MFFTQVIYIIETQYNILSLMDQALTYTFCTLGFYKLMYQVCVDLYA